MPTKEQGKEFDSTSAFPRMASLGKKHELVSILPTAHKKRGCNLKLQPGWCNCTSGDCGYGLCSPSPAPEHGTSPSSVPSPLSTVLGQAVRVPGPLRPSHPKEALCNFITPCNVKLQLALIHPFPPRTAQPLPPQHRWSKLPKVN